MKIGHPGPKRQHYTPVFYLNRWSGPDGRVHVVRKIHGKIARSNHPPKYLGFENHLYSYSENFDAVDRAKIETKFLAPLDNEGARIIAELIAGSRLEKRDYILWAQFLTTMRVRVPENVEILRVEGSKAILREIEAAQAEYAVLKRETDPETAVGWIEVNRPGLIESFGVRQLPRIASNPKLMQDVLSFSWHIVNFGTSSKLLLSSDRPCVYTEGLDKPDCVIALPLSPRHAFFAFRPNSRAQRSLANAPISKLAARLNDNVVSQAVTRAYCQGGGDAPDAFFLRRLGRAIPAPSRTSVPSHVTALNTGYRSGIR
jgi:Protein of unknown function (DUF4238)